MGLIARSWKRGSPWKEPVPNQNWSFREFENARLELFASSPLVANRHGSLYLCSVYQRRKFCSYSCFQMIFKVGLANYNFFYLLSRHKMCFSLFWRSIFENSEPNMIETTRWKEKNLPSKQPKQILKEYMYSIKKIL